MTLPRILILRALKQTFESAVPNLAADPAKRAWKVRHWRNRDSTIEEMPCVAIRYLGDDTPDISRGADDPQQLSLAEEVFHLNVELVIDAFLTPESDRDTAGDADEGDDPTGLEQASDIAKTCLGAIFKKGQEINTMGGLIWDARYNGTGDNDDVGTPDIVRLAERLTLVYRVRAEAPHELLIGE